MIINHGKEILHDIHAKKITPKTKSFLSQLFFRSVLVISVPLFVVAGILAGSILIGQIV